MGDEKESLEQRIQRAVREEIAIAPYDPMWPESFRREKEHLRSSLPGELIRRVEHFGSTAVPGLAAKPIIDLLVEVTDLEATKVRIVPVEGTVAFAEHWDRLLFRDYLIDHPQVARAYEVLKMRLAASSSDRVAYTTGKTEFVLQVTADAKRYYSRRHV